MRRIGTLLLGVVPALLIAATAMAVDCQTPTALGDGWKVAAPLDRAQGCRLAATQVIPA